MTGFVGAVSSTYSVSIISDPRQGPFRVGQAVNFSCVVDPALDDVTYQWRAVDHGRSRSFTQQNITIYYRGIYLRYCLYFCYVWQHETLINSSNLMVEIQGKKNVKCVASCLVPRVMFIINILA